MGSKAPARINRKTTVNCSDTIFVDDEMPEIHRGREYRFPFDQLGIGQCFIVKGMDRNVLGSYKRYAERALGRHFKTKRHKGGIGVWRVQ